MRLVACVHCIKRSQLSKAIVIGTVGLALPVATARTLAAGLTRHHATTYGNPVLAGDYSDPDVVRVGEDYYLVASSFSNTPGLPILHSRNLVDWTLIGHVLPRVTPNGHYSVPRRGGGVWAPAIVYRDGLFRIYYPDPDRGIFVVTAKDPRGPWTDPILVDATRGAIDPAPFWDDDGSAWLAFAFAQSRAGVGNRIMLKRMNATGTTTVGDARLIIDGSTQPPVRTSIGPRPWQTTEGPKLYKRDGWYWLFAPSGSVKGGWQGVFRARSLTGPWEGRNVMDQGRTTINGPHQGAWLHTAAGEDWFVHFSDADSYGRQVHLQPMHWRDGWPVIGRDDDGDGIGEPVETFRRPVVRGAIQTSSAAGTTPKALASDEFDGPLSLEWQWQANPQDDWIGKGAPGWLRLTSASTPVDLWEAGNLLSAKLPGERFVTTAKLRFAPLREGERTGLAMFGADYSWIGLVRDAHGVHVERVSRIVTDGERGTERGERGPAVANGADIWLRLAVEPIIVADPIPGFSPYWPSMLRSKHARVRFSYSSDGRNFIPLGGTFVSKPGRWTGAQIGIFAQAPSGTPSFAATMTGYAEYDWVRSALAPVRR